MTEVRAERVSNRDLPDEITAAGTIDAVRRPTSASLSRAGWSRSLRTARRWPKGSCLPGSIRAISADPGVAEAKLGEVSSPRAAFPHARPREPHGDATSTRRTRPKEAEAADELAHRQLDTRSCGLPLTAAVRHGVAVGVVVVPAVPAFTVLAPPRSGPMSASPRARRPACGPDRPSGSPALRRRPRVRGLSRGHTAAGRPIFPHLYSQDPPGQRRPLLHAGNVMTARIATGTVHRAVTLPPLAVQSMPTEPSTHGPSTRRARPPPARPSRRDRCGRLRGNHLRAQAGRPGRHSVPMTVFEGMRLHPNLDP